MDMPSSKISIIKNIYLYLVSFVALLMVVFSTADVINLVLRTYIFTKADYNAYDYQPVACPTPAPTSSYSGVAPCITQAEQEKIDEDNLVSQHEQSLVRDISFILVGIPLFLYHWGVIRKKEMA